MTTISTRTMVFETNSRMQQQIFSGRGVFSDVLNLKTNKIILQVNNVFQLSFSKFCFAYFEIPTLIQLTIGGVITSPTVNGTLILPFAGEIAIAHPGPGYTGVVKAEIVSS